MSKIPDSQPTLKQPTSRRQTFRVFVDVPGAGWKLIGGMSGSMKPRKLPCIPECAGMTVRAALANIRIERRKPAALNYLMIERWKIGDDGVADPDDQFQHVVARIIATGKGDPIVSVPTKEDVEAIKRCLGLGDR